MITISATGAQINIDLWKFCKYILLRFSLSLPAFKQLYFSLTVFILVVFFCHI